jgi:hypothetical protein
MSERVMFVGRSFYKVMMDDTNFAVCEECGCQLSIGELKNAIFSEETGFLYCSPECACNPSRLRKKQEKR